MSISKRTGREKLVYRRYADPDYEAPDVHARLRLLVTEVFVKWERIFADDREYLKRNSP